MYMTSFVYIVDADILEPDAAAACGAHVWRSSWNARAGRSHPGMHGIEEHYNIRNKIANK